MADTRRFHLTQRRLHDVGDLLVNDLPNRVVAPALRRQDAEESLHFGGGFGPNLDLGQELLFVEQPVVEPVVEIVAVVRDFIGQIGNLRFKRRLVIGVKARGSGGQVEVGIVLGQAFANFPAEIEAGEARVFPFELFHHSQALAVVFESTVTLHQLIEPVFSGVAEG